MKNTINTPEQLKGQITFNVTWSSVTGRTVVRDTRFDDKFECTMTREHLEEYAAATRSNGHIVNVKIA